MTALCNRKRVNKGLVPYNKKRVYRVMKENGLLLPAFKSVRGKHKATGKIMTLYSNTRWCSDCFEIHCFNGEKVYVAFVLDTCDRQVISFTASDQPLLSEDIQGIMMKLWRKDLERQGQIERLSFYRIEGVFTELIMCRCWQES